jgi:hypothetical protein
MLVLASQRLLLRISAAGTFSKLDLTTQTMIDGLRAKLVDRPVCRKSPIATRARATHLWKGSRR